VEGGELGGLGELGELGGLGELGKREESGPAAAEHGAAVAPGWRSGLANAGTTTTQGGLNMEGPRMK